MIRDGEGGVMEGSRGLLSQNGEKETQKKEKCCVSSVLK